MNIQHKGANKRSVIFRKNTWTPLFVYAGRMQTYRQIFGISSFICFLKTKHVYNERKLEFLYITIN